MKRNATFLREGVNFRMPAKVKVLTALKVEAYQRVSEPHDGYGFNLSGDLRWKKLSVTAGVMSVDQVLRHADLPAV